MCRNIRTLANFAPPATTGEIRASALQFVRKVSGANKPSRANEELFLLLAGAWAAPVLASRGRAPALAAFAVAYPFAAAQAYWGCFIAAAALFALFSIPAFVVLPGDPRHDVPLSVAATRGLRQTRDTLREILGSPERRQMRRFLTAYLVYEDGVNTVVAFSAIFAAQTLGFPMGRLIVLYIVVQVSALLGALVGILLMLPLNGMTTGTSNAVTFSEIVFSLRMTVPVVVTAVGFALIMGLFGGIAPAWHAARRDIVVALRD